MIWVQYLVWEYLLLSLVFYNIKAAVSAVVV